MNGSMDSSTGPAVALQPRVRSDDHAEHTTSQHSPVRSALPHWVFLLTLLCTLVMGWALHDASTKAHNSSRWVSHSHQVLRAISEIDNSLSRVEAAMRGYVVSGNPSFLLERDITSAGLHDEVRRLQRLLTDSPEHQARADAVRRLIADRITIMDETTRGFERGGAAAAAATLGAAQDVRGAIDQILADLRDTEERLLEARQQQEDARHERTLILLIGAGALAFLILVPSYIAFTRQVRSRARLERRLYNLADSIPGVVYRYRSHAHGGSRYQFLSRNVEPMFEVSRKAALHDPAVIGNLVLDEDRPALAAAVAAAAETLTPLEHEFRIRTPSGAIKWVRSSAAPRKLADGSVVWNGHWADFTRQKELERALHDAKETADGANRAKSAFLAVMSHEIRTPLNGVLGMLELLSFSKLEPDQRATLNVVRESGKSLQRIIDDILDLSKIEAGKLEISPTPSSVHEVVHSVRNIYSGNASSKGLLLICTVEKEISPAHVFDPLRLRQVLSNFVSNAIKFTPTGRIEIGAELVGRAGDSEVLRFMVADRGIGMTPEVQARLFQPFVQAGASTARAFGGTGLGLTISAKLAALMGATISVESELGQGTTMILTVTLPVADPALLQKPAAAADDAMAPIAVSRATPTPQQAELDGTLVLLADDHPTNRLLLSRQLNMLGYAVECAVNGVEAFQMWLAGRFGAVVSDINMPELDGYGLARRIRAHEAQHHLRPTPLIACTANALRGEAEACLESGMNDYIAKPVRLGDLQQKLNHWLPLPQRPAELPDEPTESPRHVTSVIDRATLAAVSGGEIGAERDILTDFKRVNDDDAAELYRAVHAGDYDAVTRTAHRMKGASRMVGLLALSAACDRIEAAGRARDARAVRTGMTKVEEELARVDYYIDRHAA